MLPPLVIGDPATRRIVEANLQAIRTGDPSEVVKMLEGGLKAGEPPPPERQATYHIQIPLLAVDGQPCVGRSINIVYKGSGQTVELAVNGALYTVSLMQLAMAIGSLRNAMSFGGPIPQF